MRIVLASTYLPRRCGLATFTHDLRAALHDAEPDWDLPVLALDRDALAYGPEVMSVIRQDSPADYRKAARRIAAAGVDLVMIQHEYGIFGGPDGNYVLDFAVELWQLGVPYTVTLHTVLSSPSPGQAATLAQLCAHADKVTVFTETAARLAVSTGVARPGQLVVVPHGAPAVLRTLIDPDVAGPAVGDALDQVGDARIVSTFGLIGPGKGLEHGIAALPALVSAHPDTVYLIAGTTHPEVIRSSGESYRDGLVDLATRLGVAKHVQFIDAFLTEPELAVLLGRTHVYLTPYRSPEQICSGALTFAVAAGCPTVSTDYLYARDVLAPRDDHSGAGSLVPCEDVPALGNALVRMFDDESARHRAYLAADSLGATLTWPAVGVQVADVARSAAQTFRRPAGRTLRPLRLEHLDRMTDEIGIIQFARGVEPATDSGYCVDDVARLAVAATGLYTLRGQRDPRPGRWLASSLRFLENAASASGFRNLMGYDAEWLDEPHLGDHLGRALWALGVVASADLPSDLSERAWRLLLRTASLLDGIEFARPHAYALLGLSRVDDPALRPAIAASAARLAAPLAGASWFEPRLTYDNARLPQALLVAGRRLGDADLVAEGERTLRWYLRQVGLASSGDQAILRNVGNEWRSTEADVPVDDGDEQPLDAAATVEALTDAWRVTHRWRYGWLAVRAFGWFDGVNRAGVPLYDPETGGCRDGLSAGAANTNQGAESTLAYYQALLAVVHSGLVAPPAPPAQTRPRPWRLSPVVSRSPVRR